MPANSSVPPPAVPRAGATTRAPTHRTDHPQDSTTADPPFATVPPGRRVTRFSRAIDAAAASVAASNPAPSPTAFSPLDENSATSADSSRANVDTTARGDIPDEATAREDGASQPLLDESMPVDEVAIIAVQMLPPAPTTIETILNDHDLAVSAALADVTTSPGPALSQPNRNVEDSDDNDSDNDDFAGSPTTLNATLQSILRYIKKNDRAVTTLTRTTTSEVARIDSRLDAIGERIDLLATGLNKTTDKLGDLGSKVGHHVRSYGAADESITTRMDSFIEATHNRFEELNQRFCSRGLTSTGDGPGLRSSRSDDNGTVTVIDVDDGTTPSPSSGPDCGRGTDEHGQSTFNGTGTAMDGTTLDHSPAPGASTRRNAEPTGLVLPEDVYTLPSGHFGSGLRGPSAATRITARGFNDDATTSDYHQKPSTVCDTTATNTTASNARAAHMAGPAGRVAGLTPARSPPVNPYTPSRTLAAPTITPPRVETTYTDDFPADMAPNNGGPILSPRAQEDRTRGRNRFDLAAMANPPYHGNADGTRQLTFGFLENCGYNTLTSDDIVGSLNEIIALHGRIRDTWFNASANTYGPQIDRILLKSFKLFPTLDSVATADVVDFYDRLQELSNPHLLPLIPFDSIILKYRFEGLFPPGLGTLRYATCGRALMDFLPRLIPATLSSRINATLTAVRCESMNGYDYLWRVLALYVPGFDPVLAGVVHAYVGQNYLKRYIYLIFSNFFVSQN